MKHKKQIGSKFLRTVEWLGNVLPHPVILFVILIAILIVGSAIGEYFNVMVQDPRPIGAKGRAEDGLIRIISLINPEGIRKILTHGVDNFTGFAPLGTVLVSLLGVGIAERSGLISAVLRMLVMNTPKQLTTLAVVFAGVVSNMASELGYVVLIPLAAVIFHSLGRHPLAGLAAAFAGVSGGYSANLLLGTVDPLLSGISQQAARIIDTTYVVGVESNWYFMFVSTFLITILGYFITEKIVEPALGPYDVSTSSEELETFKSSEVTPLEKKGMLYVAIATVVFFSIVALGVVPENGILRNQTTGLIANSPFLKSIVMFIFIFFAIIGIIFGYVTKNFQKKEDIVDAMDHSMKTLSLYLVIIFFSAQFVAFFGWTNIGQVIAVKGADFLQSIDMPIALLFVGFILICAFINLMIGSASAQWAITAPIFIPMLMLTGFAPEMIQAAYRIGDSVTNIITPMMSYFGLIMSIAIRYNKNAGVGTLISIMLPYSIIFLIGWTLLFVVYVFFLGLPVGPGSATYYSIG